MMPQIQKDTPPFVRFELMEYGVNAEASERSGRPIPNVIPFALIMQHGSKDCVEKPADEWLSQITKRAIDGQFNPEWVQRYKLQYEEWKKGNELPREGTPIKTCPLFNREQASRLVALGITTVEDLASQPDQALGGIGLDGRYLRDAAKQFITDGKDAGKTALELAALKETVREQGEIIKRLEAKNAELDAAVPASAKRETLTVKK